MAIKFRIPQDQIPDLETIRDLGSASLQQVIDHLATLERLPLRPAELLANRAEALGGDFERAVSLVRPLLAMNQLIRQRVKTVDGVLDGLRSGLAQLPSWTSEQRYSLATHRASIEQALSG